MGDFASTVPAEAIFAKANFEDVITYQCAVGHTLEATPDGHNHFEVECQASKAFTEAKSCKPIECPKVPKVDHATPKKTSATYNQSVRFDCDEGHTVDGTASGDHGFTVTCQTTGQFGEAQACKRVTCGVPPEAVYTQSAR